MFFTNVVQTIPAKGGPAAQTAAMRGRLGRAELELEEEDLLDLVVLLLLSGLIE